jgi:macrolide transport system ATP-binding/permease protein
MLSGLKARLRALLRKSEMERELDEELRYHIEQQTDQNIRLGMNPEEARQAARKAFGGVEQAKERSRDTRGVRWIGDLWQDLRFGARMLLKSPGLTLIAVITLGLGIGANTTIFSAMESLILHPFALPNQSRLMVIYERNLNVGVTRTGVAPGNLRDWSTQSQTFERFVSWQVEFFDLAGADQPERVMGYRVSAEFFAALGVQPLLGRDFQPDEDTAGREQVVILKHSLWRQRFGSDPNILGQSIRLNSKA